MKVVAVIQARMGSTRLPGKVSLDIAGKPMLARVVERAQRISEVDQVVVATTTSRLDERVAEIAREAGVEVFRGDENLVLARYREATRRFAADVVVRITSDCPLIDPGVAGIVLRAVTAGDNVDFAANTFDRTYPRGLDTEAAPAATLDRLCETVTEPHHWQHVFPYIYEHRAEFRVVSITNGRNLSSLRWTVDTPEDLEFVRAVYRYLPGGGDDWAQVITLLDQHPELMEINRAVAQKPAGDC